MSNEAVGFKFVTRKWSIVNDQSNANYGVGNEVIYKAEVLKCNLCDYRDAYILVRGDINILGDNGTQLVFKNCAPFIKCITKIDGTTIDDAEHSDLVMPMYSLLEYISYYSEATGSLWFYSKDEATNCNANIGNDVTFEYFIYKTKLVGEANAKFAPSNNNRTLKNGTIAVPLKCLSTF